VGEAKTAHRDKASHIHVQTGYYNDVFGDCVMMQSECTIQSTVHLREARRLGSILTLDKPDLLDAEKAAAKFRACFCFSPR